MDTKAAPERHCAICGAEQRFQFEYRGFDYCRCRSCAHVTTYPFPDEETIESHYASKFEEGNYSLNQEFSEQYVEGVLQANVQP